ncbi:ScyD/ScyE family protein [uncultured Jannaschia sp.]|uniref:ScyD/ScyE family protein n=1 Tax=uncultured Jannaschia sp. TaxID=293347 RepID=UPI00262DB572|nr:ScyD/ScyE family protein [uncultured Jannaschia sp.]
MLGEVVLDGLANPRGMVVGSDGWLYVAEAGSGGDGASITGGDGATLRYGDTGAVTRYRNGVRENVAVDLPSLASDGGFGATGAHDVAFHEGELHVVFGFGGDPNQRGALAGAHPDAALLGQVGRVSGGSVAPVADIASLELDGGPDDDADSNPFSLVAGPDGLVVSDAGGNDIVAIGADGSVAPVAVLSPEPNPLPFGPPVYQAVPTGIAAGPDGTLAIAQLTGFPFPEGAANVFGLAPDGSLDTLAGGFTNLIDVAFGADGSLFALETDSDSLLNPGTTGALYELFADGSRALLLDGIESPTGLALGPEGTFYVATNGLSPTGGQVVALNPAPAPIPLPAGLPMLAAGLAGLGLLRRRR